MTYPLLRLSTRRTASKSRSGSVGRISGDLDRLRTGTRPALILVHGFATDEEHADSAYQNLVGHVMDAVWPQRLPPLVEVFAFHWPGNHRLHALNKPTFSARIESAARSGDRLGELLAGITHRDVILVAHSLGCNVVLATLEYLIARGGGGRVRHAVLLAAAVPVRLCRRSPFCHGDDPCDVCSEFAHRLPNVTYTVFHSRHDLVLALTFPLGRLGFDALGEAVGSRGRPRGDRWDERVPTTHGHSEYWPSREVADRVAGLIAPRARVALRKIRMGPLPTLEAPPTITPARRELPRRELPGGR